MRLNLSDVTRALGVVQTIASCEASRASAGSQLAGAGDSWSRAVNPYDPPALLILAGDALSVADALSMSNSPPSALLADADEMIGVGAAYAAKQLEIQPEDGDPLVRYAWERAVRALNRAQGCSKRSDGGDETSSTQRRFERRPGGRTLSRYPFSDDDGDGPTGGWSGRLDRLN